MFICQARGSVLFNDLLRILSTCVALILQPNYAELGMPKPTEFCTGMKSVEQNGTEAAFVPAVQPGTMGYCLFRLQK